MCLEYVFTKKEREKVLAKLPEEFIVWKVLGDWGVNQKNRYRTDCRHLRVHAGETKFKINVIYGDWLCKRFCYRGGGHFWLHKEDAEKWAIHWMPFACKRITRCRVKKEWIINIGVQEDGVVIVTKKAVFPKYIGQIEKN